MQHRRTFAWGIEMTVLRKRLVGLSATAVGASVALTTALLGTSTAAAPTCFGQPATIVGTDGDDTLHGTAGNDVIVAGGGSDDIFGEGGDDLLCASSPDATNEAGQTNRLYGGPGNDEIDGGPGEDQEFGEDGNDILYGRGGLDQLDDGPGNDQAYGGRLNDSFIAGSGDDVLVGGPSSESTRWPNEVSYATSPSPVTIDLRADTATGDGNDIVKHIWGAIGSPYEDVIKGTPRADRLVGGCGDDRLFGRAGKDFLFGGIDRSGGCARPATDGDTLHGGDGKDFLSGGDWQRDLDRDAVYGDAGDDDLTDYGAGNDYFGGSGSDTFAENGAAESGDSLRIDLREGTFAFHGHAGVVDHVENVFGTDGDDVIYGNGRANLLVADMGEDKLYGRGGDDVLRGDFERRQIADMPD